MLFASAYEDWRSNASLGEALALVLDPKSDVLIACGERRHRAFHQAQLDVFKGRSFNFCGELSLQESMALIARAQLVVGVDSGPCHVAGALDIPHCVVVGGGHFGVFYPWHPETTLVLNPLTCFGCQWKCPYPRRHCLDGIEPAMIAEGIRNALHTQRKRNSSRSLVLCVDPANQPIPSLDLALHVNPERVQVMKIEYPSFENRNSNAGAHA
jgi:hypothetical protein